MKVFYENVKYTMLMENVVICTECPCWIYSFILQFEMLDITKTPDVDSVSEHNTNGLFL